MYHTFLMVSSFLHRGPQQRKHIYLHEVWGNSSFAFAPQPCSLASENASLSRDAQQTTRINHPIPHLPTLIQPMTTRMKQVSPPAIMHANAESCYNSTRHCATWGKRLRHRLSPVPPITHKIIFRADTIVELPRIAVIGSQSSAFTTCH